jgi:hypothetical protein
MSPKREAFMNKPSGKHEPSVKSKEDDHGSKPQADQPDERLKDFLRDRFPDGLPPSQSPKEENPEDVEDRKSKRKGKKQVPVRRRLPKPKEE